MCVLYDLIQGYDFRFPSYSRAAANVEVVSRLTVQLVLRLQKLFPASIETRNIHFIGFSLGGQMAGYFAREYFTRTGTRVGNDCTHVTDPSGTDVIVRRKNKKILKNQEEGSFDTFA